jgi:hypothetical protein
VTDPNSAAPPADPAANPNPGSPPPAAVVPPAVPPNSNTAVPPPQDPTKPAGPTFASTWRADIAGGDDKAAKLLERYATPQDFTKAYLEAVGKIRSGELAKPLPKDATPEQVAEWRKGNNIPEKPEGYFEKLPNGLVIGEDDKPMFDAVAAKLHARNVQPEVIHDLAEWYYGMQDQQIKTQQDADAVAKPALEAKLRETWGADFKANANVYASYLESAPKEVQDVLKSARDAEGNFILYRPEVVSWLVAQAREINPAGHITPAGNEGTVQSVQAEIDKIEKFMRTNRTEYNKDEKMQARARQLYTARAKLQERGRAA